MSGRQKLGVLAGLSAWMLFCSLAQEPTPVDPTAGKELFTANCARCHGADGAKGKWGAKDLRYSALPDSGVVHQVEKGKGIMPAFRKKLTTEQIDQLMRYVKLLRQ
jgi:cytochrome c6